MERKNSWSLRVVKGKLLHSRGRAGKDLRSNALVNQLNAFRTEQQPSPWWQKQLLWREAFDSLSALAPTSCLVQGVIADTVCLDLLWPLTPGGAQGVSGRLRENFFLSQVTEFFWPCPPVQHKSAQDVVMQYCMFHHHHPKHCSEARF